MSKRDEFDDPEGFFGRLITVKGKRRNRLFENRSLVFSVVVFGVVVALSSVIWASYPSQNPLTADGSVPIIRADTAAYKAVPEDRGGMAIAHRDSTIFDAMRDGEQPDRKVENLLDDSNDEKPIDRAELFAGLKTDLAEATDAAKTKTDATPDTKTATAPADSKDVQVARMGDYATDRPMTEAERRDQAARRNQELLKEPAQPLPGDGETPATTATKGTEKGNVIDSDDVKPSVSTDASEEPDEPETITTKPTKGLQEKPAKVADEKPAAKEPIKETAKTEKTAKPASAKSSEVAVKTGTGSSYVQVASVPNEGLIKSEWATVSGKLPMIKGLPYRAQKADLGAKGTFHRIQVGPMSKDDAAKLCAAIKAQKPGGCLVVK